MTKRKDSIHRLTALLLMVITLMTVVCPVLTAGAEQIGEIPMESVSPYRIVLTAPGGWSSNGAVMKVSITDRENMGWYKIEYRMNDGRWIDCEDLFDKNKAEVNVRENGTFTLRMTDPHGHEFEESAQVECIDLTAPVVSASINGMTLQVDARDALSGIAGVQINSMLFTTLTNGSLNVELDQNMNKFEKLAVRAFDYAGNFSDPITLDNPHYEKPADPTLVPTATPKPTKKPSSESSGQTETQVTNTPAATQHQAAQSTTTTNPYHGLGSSLIYVYDEPVATTVPTQAPTPEPIIQTEYITIGPGMPYQADGNSHTLDVLYSAATNKQFITIQTKSGNTFYLVIDYDKPLDEGSEMYETHFLNLVDERDLLALMSDEEKQEVPTPTPEIIYVTPVPTAVPAPTPTAAPTVEPEKPDKPDQMTALLALAAIVVLGGVGAFLFFRSKSNAPKPRTDTDLDMDDEDEDETESTNE